jgi:hypothetical protein
MVREAQCPKWKINLMENIDYTASSTLWVLPWKTGMAGQPMELHNIPFSDAIRAMLNLPPDEQQKAHIETAGRPDPVRIDEAKAISQRRDFPAD